MSDCFSRSNLQALRSKQPPKHKSIIYSFGDVLGTTLTCGDVGILHNLALLFQMKNLDKKFKPVIDRFHITVRTMRRSTYWDWVKPDHINLVLGVLQEINENFDDVVASYKQGEAFMLEQMEEQVASGVMSEGDYNELAVGMKKPHEFITGSEFKQWVANRAEFYESLHGEMPTIKLVPIPDMNAHDGKCLLITSQETEEALALFKQNKQ